MKHSPNEPLLVPEFPTFSVQELMLKGKLLLGSSGKEFIKPVGILSNATEVKKARKDAMKRLGLDFLDNIANEMDLDKELAGADPDVNMEVDVKAEETPLSPMDVCPPDIKISLPTRSVTPADPSPTTPNDPSAPADLTAMSARERNRLKRKRKPGNSAFVAAPPPQATGTKYSATATGSSSK